MKLSVVCSGYRSENFRRLYDSIAASFSQEWELIICGPSKPDFETSNLIWIEDFGCPSRCCQRALSAASGEWVSFAWDDGYYLPGMLDKVYQEICTTKRTGYVGKFYEVTPDPAHFESNSRYQEKDDLYYVATHNEARSDKLPHNFVIFGTGMVAREDLARIGGFDTQYETYAIALLDISIRLQLDGVIGRIYPNPTFTCKWSHGEPGHEVIQEAYEQKDKQAYQSKYRSADFGEIVVDPSNWTKSPHRWARRWPYNVSVIMPTIRTHLLQNVYDSIGRSFHGTWELVLVGPNNPPPNVINKGNVTWIQSYRSPIACRQQALLAAKGDLICYAADDVTFITGSLDEAYQTIERHNFDYKFIVAGKYLENVTDTIKDSPVMRQDAYYHLNHHAALVKSMEKFPQNWLIVNTGLISKKLLMEVGGWDTDFEVCSMACIDLSMRLQNYGAIVHLQNNPIFHSTWFRDRDGDHGPIHDAHTDHDLPLYREIWERPDAVDRKIVDINKWETTPERWVRRFSHATSEAVTA